MPQRVHREGRVFLAGEQHVEVWTLERARLLQMLQGAQMTGGEGGREGCRASSRVATQTLLRSVDFIIRVS